MGEKEAFNRGIMAKNKVTDLVEQYFTAGGFAGYRLYESEFVKEGPDHYLRVYIEREDGDYVSTDDCELVSRGLSDLLDRDDPIEQNYYLEVSSPGLDRILTRPEHFQAVLGEEIELSLYKARKGSKKLAGKLVSFDEENVTIAVVGEGEVSLPRKEIAKANLAVVF